MKVVIATLAPVLGILLTGYPGAAHAQSASRLISAETLFDEGRAFAKDGDQAAACLKFAESQKLAPAVGTLLNLGDCYEKTERFASAWASFREAATLASHSGQAQRAEYASQRQASVAERLSRLRIELAPAAQVPGLEVRRGEDVVSTAEIGSAVPVDHGTIVVTAIAPGKERWSGRIAIAVGETGSIMIPALLDEASRPSSERETANAGAAQRKIGLVVGGVGILGIVVGTASGLVAKSKNDEALTHCRGDECAPRGLELTSSAQTAATMSTVAFVVGGIALAGGAVLWLTAPRGGATKSASRIGVATAAGPNDARLELRGVW